MNLIGKRLKKSNLQERNKRFIAEEEVVKIPVAAGLSAVGVQLYPPVCEDLM